MNPKTQPDGSFLATVQTHRKGVMLLDLDTNMRELVNQVRRTSQAGTMTIKIKISPNSKGSIEILKLEDEISLSRVKTLNGASIYYADEEGGLLRNDPKQMEHPALVEVPDDRITIKQLTEDKTVKQAKA